MGLAENHNGDSERWDDVARFNGERIQKCLAERMSSTCGPAKSRMTTSVIREECKKQPGGEDAMHFIKLKMHNPK